MKLFSTLLLAPLVASLSIHSSSNDASALDAAFPVPGEQPLNFCKDPKDYLLEVHNVDLTPNPPVPGQKLTIKANGTFTQDIEEGAKVFLQVRYGLITLIKQEADLCENLPKIDIECPLNKGYMEVFKEVDIPRQVPPGKYTVLADIHTKDGEEITCMETTIIFHR